MKYTNYLHKRLFNTKFIKKIGNTPISIAYHIPDTLLYTICRVFPVRKKIAFTSYFGKDYGDNPKYIAEKIIEENLFDDIIWLVSDKKLLTENHLPKEIRAVYSKSLRGVYEQATAKVWIDNARKPFYVLKRKTQIYIQTWHGSIALKKIEKDAWATLPKSYIRNAMHDSNICDLMVSGSKYISRLYRDAFWYDGDILECGDARNDILISADRNKRESILNQLFDGKRDFTNKKILLYAPTFRVSGRLDVYDIDFKRCCDALRGRFESEWICLMRLHPNIAEKSSNLNINHPNIIDVSSYPDMQELLAISDVLITDYSSCMFDFMLTKRPCFLYTPDVADYMDDRGFYMSLDELPFPRGNTNDELIEAIRNFQDESYQEQLTKFKDKVQIYDKGNASKAVVDWIKERLESEKKK